MDAARASGLHSLSEPDFFTQAVATRILQGPIFPGYVELARVVRTLTEDLLIATAGEGSGSSLVKLRTECCKAPGLIVGASEARPQSIFMIRAFKSWAASFLRVSTRKPQSIVTTYIEGLRCLQWQRRETDCLLVKYEDLTADPPRELARILAALGMQGSVSLPENVRRKDSQADTPLSRKATEREVPAGVLQQTLDLWSEARPGALLADVGLAEYC
jgi:hypothetical protein